MSIELGYLKTLVLLTSRTRGGIIAPFLFVPLPCFSFDFERGTTSVGKTSEIDLTSDCYKDVFEEC